MIRVPRLRTCIALFALLVLVACSQPAVEPGQFDIRANANDTLPAVSQAISVSDRLNWGLRTQTVAELELHTLRTVDLDGEPFIDITVSAPVSAGGFWDLAFSVSGDEWDPEDATSAWTTTLTGASTARDVLIVSNVGLTLPLRLARTVEALGGLGNVAEVVAIEQQTFAVRDLDGSLWDTYTHEPLPPETVTSLEDMYGEMVRANSNPETAARLHAEWGEILSADTAGVVRAQAVRSGSGIDIAELTLADGNLDVRKVAALLDASAEGLAPLTRYPDSRHCFLFICNHIQTGYIPTSRQALHSGDDQYPSDFGRTGTFAMPYCVITGTVNYQAPLGCAPAAFVGLIQRKFLDGTKFFGVTYNSSGNRAQQLNTLASNLTAPLGLHGRPLIANYMGTCWNTGGSMTIGVGFRDGARAFLRDQNLNLTVTSNISHYTGNVTSAPAKAAILIRNIGDKNNPVIAEYFRGFGQGHYSPVTHYAIYDTGSNGLNVRTLSDPNEWMLSLSGTWGTERGVFALE